ncbi:MAG: Sjogren's syndrome/scleroderma autoantigen 1 family protein [Halobellus sp.]
MSDFDEEAERRRLREKYEKDEERRKETQRMSELLLKGATMTNQHCGECGSPIFRYDGQEFCPSCQRVAGDGESDAEAERAQQGDEPAQGDASADATSPTSEADAGTDSVEVDAVGPVDDEGGSETVGESASARDSEERPGVTGQRDTDPGPTPASGRSAHAPPSGEPTDVGSTSSDVGEARAALLRALTRHAELAEATEDPRRAKEHLAAAREASEALDALGR